MTSMDTTNSGPGWTVNGQQEQTIITPNGQAQDVMVITFTLTDGTVGTVSVPMSGYNVENVRAAIAAKAAQLHAVNQLTG